MRDPPHFILESALIIRKSHQHLHHSFYHPYGPLFSQNFFSSFIILTFHTFLHGYHPNHNVRHDGNWCIPCGIHLMITSHHDPDDDGSNTATDVVPQGDKSSSRVKACGSDVTLIPSSDREHRPHLLHFFHYLWDFGGPGKPFSFFSNDHPSLVSLNPLLRLVYSSSFSTLMVTTVLYSLFLEDEVDTFLSWRELTVRNKKERDEEWKYWLDKTCSCC